MKESLHKHPFCRRPRQKPLPIENPLVVQQAVISRIAGISREMKIVEERQGVENNEYTDLNRRRGNLINYLLKHPVKMTDEQRKNIWEGLYGKLLFLRYQVDQFERTHGIDPAKSAKDNNEIREELRKKYPKYSELINKVIKLEEIMARNRKS